MCKTYYKVARPDGWDFKTGDTINYRDNIGERVTDPQYFKGARCCARGVIHASEIPFDALKYLKLPCSVYRVIGRPVHVLPDKAGFKSLRILEEIPESELSDLFGFDYHRTAHPTNPLEIDNDVTEEDIQNLQKWASVWGCVCKSMIDSIGDDMRDVVRDFVWDYVWAPVWMSIRLTIGSSVWSSVWASAWAYIGSCFPDISDWKYIEHEPGVYPFRSAVDLWERGFVPVRMNGTWHLWKQNGGIVYTMEEE